MRRRTFIRGLLALPLAGLGAIAVEPAIAGLAHLEGETVISRSAYQVAAITTDMTLKQLRAHNQFQDAVRHGVARPLYG